MQINKEDITSFLTFRHPLSALKNYNYGYDIHFSRIERSFGIVKEKIASLLKTATLNSIKNYNKIGVMMSCGVDSLVIAKILKDYGVNTVLYTAKFEGDDECDRAVKAVKNFIGLPHIVVEIQPEDYTNSNIWLDKLTSLKLEPLHPNEIALAKAERKARDDGCDVVICGEGADDIFGGYNKIVTWYKKALFSDFLSFYRYFSIDQRSIIHEDLLMSDHELLKQYLNKNENSEYYFQYFVQKLHTPGLIKRGKNAGLANNLEVKFPYMYPHLINFANTLPLEYKIFGSKIKYVLRETARDHLGFPQEYAYSPKHPFPVPLDRWMEDINSFKSDDRIFSSSDISHLGGWHKWMIINLNSWAKTQL